MEIWRNRIDNTYDVFVVQGDSAHTGVLHVELDGKTLFTKDVGVSYGAIFGPDSGDVNDWATMALDFVDTLDTRLTN